MRAAAPHINPPIWMRRRKTEAPQRACARRMRSITLPLVLLLLATPTALAGFPIETPGDDKDHDGNLDEGPVCVWGWDSGCLLGAYECFQPHRRNFGLDCR